MKHFMILVLIIASVSTLAQPPKFSAFVDGDNLHLTVLGDTCNNIGGALDLAPNCRADRLTADYTIVCQAKLSVMMTELMCPSDKLVPRAFTLNLKDEMVTKEAEKLVLTYAAATIEVELEKRPSTPAPTVDNNQVIYEALNIMELVEGGAYGSITKTKTVGGLTCKMYYGGESTYECSLATLINDKDIYDALDVQVSPVNPGRVGNFQLLKKAGNLECIAETVVYPGAETSYSCELK